MLTQVFDIKYANIIICNGQCKVSPRAVKGNAFIVKILGKLGLSFEYNEMNTMTLTRTLTECYMTLDT